MHEWETTGRLWRYLLFVCLHGASGCVDEMAVVPLSLFALYALRVSTRWLSREARQLVPLCRIDDSTTKQARFKPDICDIVGRPRIAFWRCDIEVRQKGRVLTPTPLHLGIPTSDSTYKLKFRNMDRKVRVDNLK